MIYIIEKLITKPLPDMKPIAFGVDPQPSTKEEFNELLIIAFKDHPESDQPGLIKKAWNYLKAGKNLTITDKIIYCKP